MKQNKYDEESFFEQYSMMARSLLGLAGAGEWHVFREMFPPLKGKRVLDLGCGYGWHCQYAAQQGACSVLGVDLSEKMLAQAREKNEWPEMVEYRRMAIEDMDFPADSFDVVISSLAFHYVEDFTAVCRCVRQCLTQGGSFVFSVEHPVFTAQGPQDWHRGADGSRLFWPVDDYYRPGRREAVFLGEKVQKYHHTLTEYVDTLLQGGFSLTALREPQPDPKLLEQYPEMEDEMRRPMMLLIAAKKVN